MLLLVTYSIFLKESEILSGQGSWLMEPVSLAKCEGSPKRSMGEGPWRGMILGTAFPHRGVSAETQRPAPPGVEGCSACALS